ncbi:MAG: arginase family protein, partial [Pseudomonadota bacterium]
PETTESGLLEGMALSAIAGRAYRGMATRAVGLKPIDLTQTVMVGVRAMDDVERPEFERSDIAKAATADDVADALSGTDETYLHLDMDVHDPVHLAANGYPAPGGPSPAHVRALLGAVPRVAAMSVTGLDPAVAPADSAVDIAIGHIQHVARLHAEQESAQPS